MGFDSPSGLHETIFKNSPNLRRWARVDLNAEAKKFPSVDLSVKNPLLNLNVQEYFIFCVHRNNQCDASWGGYLEDRSTLWNGHYHVPEKMTHLGVDYNVPAGTGVYMPFDGRVVFSTFDEDQYGGWGGRIDFYNEELGFYFILAHLYKSVRLNRPGLVFGKGVVLDAVAPNDMNGGWFPHLHLQCVSKAEYESFSSPMIMDGYGFKTAPELELRYPNPEKMELELLLNQCRKWQLTPEEIAELEK